MKRAFAGERVQHQRNFQGMEIVSIWDPVMDDKGNLQYVVGMVQDITTQVSLERQFQQVKRLEAIGRMGAGTAHDFNNLLAVIMGNSGLLMASIPETDPLHEVAADIESATEHGADLTRQLLAFSRQQELHPEIINPQDVVASVKKLVAPILPEGVELRTAVAVNGWHVGMDPGQLEQVLMNLVMNARDAMAEGGVITIRCESAVESDEHGQQMDCVAIHVSDTGTGMDEETLSQVFDPFFTTKAHGTGLGLASVHGIIDQSGGKMVAESTLGVGSVFTIMLPRAA